MLSGGPGASPGVWDCGLNGSRARVGIGVGLRVADGPGGTYH